MTGCHWRYEETAWSSAGRSQRLPLVKPDDADRWPRTRPDVVTMDGVRHKNKRARALSPASTMTGCAKRPYQTNACPRYAPNWGLDAPPLGGARTGWDHAGRPGPSTSATPGCSRSIFAAEAAASVCRAPLTPRRVFPNSISTRSE